MTREVTRQEFEARLGEVVSEVEGEKVVSRYILEQTRRNGDDLAAVKSRLDRVENRLHGVEGRLGQVENEMRELRRELPGIVADSMREVLRERDGS